MTTQQSVTSSESFDYAQDRLSGRVFARLDPVAFRRCFLSWIRAVSKLAHPQIVAVDGRKVRRSHDRVLGKQAITMVSAWATVNRLVLGQMAVPAKSNEIRAIPPLLRLLELAGCIVTLDAIGCQTKIATTIVRQGGDYLLAVKENQGELHHDMQDLFAGCLDVNLRDAPHAYARTVNKSNGRLEIRQCWTISDPEFSDYLPQRRSWPSVRSVVLIRAERRMPDRVSEEHRYNISSLEGNPKLVLRAAQGRWGIENGLRWVLDIAFREDESWVRKDHGPENLAILRHIAVNLLKQERTLKVGIKAKRLNAAYDRKYLLKVLSW